MSRRRFQFRLEPIRMLRQDAEQTVMRELAGELAAADRLQRDVVALEGRLSAAQRPPDGTMTARDLAVRQIYTERIERECAEARARSERQKQNVELARRRLATATREREKVDRIEIRRRAAHDGETRRIEAVEVNEIALLSHLRSEGATS
jgi:flagellar export protein FliJ